MKTFVHHEQPYGTVRLTNCTFEQREVKYVDYNYGREEYTRTVGVVSGVLAKDEVKCSLIAGNPVTSSVRAKVGTPKEVWCVTPDEWERGTKTSVAM